jgi:hypothetical protein
MKMKKRNILLVLLMTVSFVVHAHGDKQKDKECLKGWIPQLQKLY